MKNLLSSLLMLLILGSLSSCAQLNKWFHFSSSRNTLRILHYNIFELDSEKIESLGASDTTASAQLLAVKEHLKEFDFNLLSVNEIQYDHPGIPYASFHTEGLNMEKLLKFLRPDHIWDIHFVEANTGAKAKKNSPQSYATSKDEGARFYADPVNYGLFPGQYSTGLASRFPIKRRIVIKDLPWKDFNSKAPIRKYRTSVGKSLPKDMPLFDKAFIDTVIEFNHQEVHVITLHTVPAFNFGNRKSPNYQRNADQLRFLEWYLTGKTDLKTKKSYEGVKPLTSFDHYIAMGDFNTDITNKKNPGSLVLERLASSRRIFPSASNTWEKHGFDTNPFSMRLDYILFSSRLQFVKSQVLKPLDKRVLLGCGKGRLPFKEGENEMVLKTYKNRKGQECAVAVSKDYATAKEASDHFPVYLELEMI